MKKIVHYDQHKTVANVAVGLHAFVYPTDHPDEACVSSTKPAVTSRVIRVGEHGEFETMNSIYRPMP